MKKTVSTLISFALLLGLVGCNSANNTQQSTTNPTTQTQETEVTVSETTLEETEPTIDVIETYTLVEGELGEYGRIITLNATTDFPSDEYLYKLPAGQYRVHLTSEYPGFFFIVKDDITTEDTEYPEILDYVPKEDGSISGYQLIGTNGNDLNGYAVAEVVITLKEDESISITNDGGADVFVFELIQPATSSSTGIDYILTENYPEDRRIEKETQYALLNSEDDMTGQ